MKCEDCGKPANGRYYYPFKGGFWLVQCKECAVCFQAFKPLKEWKPNYSDVIFTKINPMLTLDIEFH